MADRPGRKSLTLGHLVLIASILTLAVTALRVWGELKQWPTLLFHPAAGGGLALVGITWLVPVFGAWFALKLRAGSPEVRPERVVGMGALSLALVFAIHFLVGAIKKEQSSQGIIGVFAVASLLGLLLAIFAWPALARVLVVYGLAARIPVTLLMAEAMRRDWGTHYDAVPPGFPAMGWQARWFWLGVLPQLTIWMAFTVIVGTIAGGVALVVAERRPGRRKLSRPPVRPSASPGPRPPEAPAVRPAPPRLRRS